MKCSREGNPANSASSRIIQLRMGANSPITTPRASFYVIRGVRIGHRLVTPIDRYVLRGKHRCETAGESTSHTVLHRPGNREYSYVTPTKRKRQSSPICFINRQINKPNTYAVFTSVQGRGRPNQRTLPHGAPWRRSYDSTLMKTGATLQTTGLQH